MAKIIRPDIIGDRRADPTPNVRDLITLHFEGIERWVKSELTGHTEANNVRFAAVDDRHKGHLEHSRDTAHQREKALVAESTRVNSELAHHSAMMRNEIIRIDANRDGDINAVALATEKADKVAGALAERVATTAEVNRLAVESTASKMATQVDGQLGQINQKIDNAIALITGKVRDLELAIENERGKAGVSDPLNQSLMAEVSRLKEASTRTGLKFDGIQSLGGWGLPILVGIITFLFMYFKDAP